MTNTPNLALPYLDAAQAQKHVTMNESLRIIDAATQISVLDLTRTTPPTSPAEGERHVVASAPTGAWVGRAKTIATWQDGAWAFLVPNAGWCVWSIADAVVFVYDGAVWRDQRNLAVDNLAHLGVNTTASAPNLLSIKSNAALLAAIAATDGGSGDVRLQLSKESAAKTASVVFADNYSGRAEFGLVGSDAFRLKVSGDGANFVDAFVIDQTSGNLALPRGLALSGAIAPPQITSNQNDYAPTGLASASVLQLASDTARNVSGLSGGTEGRVIVVVNVGSQPITLLDESTASVVGNRFTLGGNLTLATRQTALLRYDGTAARWQVIAGATGLRASNNLSELASAATARGNLGLGAAALRGVDDYVRTDAAQSLPAAKQSQARANLGATGRNRIVNGGFEIDQRNAGASQTLPTGSINYCVDRYYVACAGAAVTGQRIAGTSTLYAYRVTGASGNSSVAFGQRIEGLNIWDLAGQAVAQTIEVSASSASALTWTASYANAANNFSSVTAIASGTIPLSATPTTQTIGFTLPTLANTLNGIVVEFSLAGLGAGQTLVFGGNHQLEEGVVATRFERKGIGMVHAECRRFFQRWKQPSLRGLATTSTSASRMAMTLPIPMRRPPTPTMGAISVFDSATTATVASIAADYSTAETIEYDLVTGSGLTPGRPVLVYQSGSAMLDLDAEL